MGGLSPWHLVIIGLLVLVIFGGKGKIANIMGDTAKGIRAFKDGLKDDAEAAKPAAPLPRTDAEKEEAKS